MRRIPTRPPGPVRFPTERGLGVRPPRQRSLTPVVAPMVHPNAVALAQRPLPPADVLPASDPLKQTMKRRKSSHPPVENVDARAMERAVLHHPGKPRPLAQNLEDLCLEPREVFVLSFVDGTLDASEIADIVGLRRIDVLKILERLARFGCISLG